MYYKQFEGHPFNPSSSTTESPTAPTFWDSLTSGQRTAILAFASSIVFIIILVICKEFGEWIVFRCIIRRRKNVVGVIVEHDGNLSSEEDGFRAPRIHFIDMSGMSAEDRFRVINAFRYQRSNTHRLGPDLPPEYNEALHLETLDFRNVTDTPHNDDCPPPSYTSSVEHPPDERTGCR